MTAAEIAEKYAVKPGFQLIDFMEVGLPVYHVILQVSTLLRKKIAPLDEFVMRCLKFGMRDCEDISAFLGLDRRIVDGVVSGLIRENNVALAADLGSTVQGLRLTLKGHKSLEIAETIVPEDKTVTIFFDALLRRPAYFREQLLKARELREEGFKEIPAMPARQPKTADFPVETVQEILRTSAGAGEKRDLLAIKRVERCNRLFRRAVALLYRSVEGGEPYVEFVLDGKLTSEYGAAFTRADGLKILGMERPAVDLSEMLPAPLSASSAKDVPASMEALRNEAVRRLEAEAEVLKTRAALDGVADESKRGELTGRLEVAELRREALEKQQKRRGVRQVYVYEHPRLLDTALTSCKERLMIISPWIKAEVVTVDFLKKVKEAVERGVQVYIGYGISGEERAEPRRADKEVEEKLTKLANRHKNFCFRRFGDTHAKVLICDSKFSVTGSFNWLSFKGDPDRTFRDEQSVLVEMPEHIDGVFRENLKRFDSQPSAHGVR